MSPLGEGSEASSTDEQSNSDLNQILLDSIPCVAMLLRPQTREVITMNKMARDQGVCIGKTCFGSWVGTESACPFCLAQEVWESGEERCIEVEYIGIFWEAHWVPIEGDLYLHYAFDITEKKKAERELERIFNFTPDMLITASTDGYFKKVNPACEKILGYTKEELLSRPFIELIHPDDVESTMSEIESQKAGNPTISFENRYRCKDGTYKWVEWTATALEDQTLLYGVGRDITERKQITKDLKESELKFRTLIEQAVDAVYLTGMDGRFVDVNLCACEMLGYTREELLALSVTDVDPVFNQHKFDNFIRELTPGECVTFEATNRRKDGSVFPIEIKTGLTTIQGTPLLVSFVRDITDRKNAEQIIKESETYLRDILASVHQGVVVYDKEFRYELWNKFMEQLTGILAEDVIGKHAFDLFPHLKEQGVDKLLRKALKGETIQSGDTPYRIPNSAKSGWVSGTYSPRFNSEGEIVGVIGAIHDVTDRIMATEELSSQRNILQALADFEEQISFLDLEDIVKNSFIFIDGKFPTGRISIALIEDDQINFRIFDTHLKIDGLNPGLIVPLVDTVLCDVVEERRPIYRPDISKWAKPYKIDQKLLDAGLKADFVIPLMVEKTCIGTLNCGAMEVDGIAEENRQLLTLIAPRLAQALVNARMFLAKEESEERFRLVIDQAGDAIFLMTTDGKFMNVNQKACDALGYTREELLELSVPDIAPVYDAERFEGLVGGMIPGRSMTVEAMHKRKDESVFPVEIRTGMIEIGGQPHILSIVRDTSDRKIAEEEKRMLEEQLRQSQKMEAVGQLAGGIAHDFNNLLTGILGYANLLKTGEKEGTYVYEAAETIEKAAKRAAELTEQLLGFARRGKYQIVAVDVNTLITDVAELLGRSFDKKIKIQLDLAKKDVTVEGDPGQLQQVLMNLAMNARDAMARGGLLAISTDVADVNLDRTEVSGVVPGKYVVITVADSGVGITEDVQQQIFDPFFSTKEPGEGTGMGLAMVYGILRNHDGYINVESNVGEGTEFNIYLPLSGSKDGHRVDVETENTEMIKGTGTILLIDDEEVVRDVVSTMLTNLGYTVVRACDGPDAVEYYKKNHKNIDMAIIDLIMPGMDGKECFLKLQKINPGIKALLSTGYGKDGLAKEVLDEGFAGFIQKPYALAELSQSVSTVLKS